MATSDRKLQQDGGSIFTGLRCHLMTLLAFVFVEASDHQDVGSDREVGKGRLFKETK